MKSRIKENEGWWKERSYFQKSKQTDNDQQESGNAEPINKSRFFFFFFLRFLLSGQKISMFNSSALGANYTAEKNDPR